MPTLRQSLENLTQDEILDAAANAIPHAQLYRTLVNDPKHRDAVLRMVKAANPNTPIPEIDAADAVRAELRERDQTIQALQQRLDNRDIQDRANAIRTACAAKYGLTEAEMKDVEALMTAETDPIPTYDAAARVYLSEQRSAVPTPSAIESTVFEMPETDVWGKGIGNPAELNRIAQREAAKAMNELRAGALRGVTGQLNR